MLSKRLPICGRLSLELETLCLLLMRTQWQSAVTTLSSSLFQSATVLTNNELLYCSILLPGILKSGVFLIVLYYIRHILSVYIYKYIWLHLFHVALFRSNVTFNVVGLSRTE